MQFLEALKSAYINIFNYQGRAARSEYWWFQLLFTALSLPVYSDSFFGFSGLVALGFLLIWTITFLAGISLAVRRLHDRDYSGWWYLLVFVPIVGQLYFLYLMLLRGTDGPNRFGRPRIPMQNPDEEERQHIDAEMKLIEERLNMLLTDPETVEKFCAAYDNKAFQGCWDIMSAAGIGDDEIHGFISAMRENEYVPELILSRRQSAD